MKVLVLGGTTEATALAGLIAGDDRFDGILSLAGATRSPRQSPLSTRIGGFGGPTGLAAYLIDRQIDVLVDATHPFAAQMSVNATAAVAQSGTPLVVIERPPWEPVPGDRWTRVPDIQGAVKALGSARQSVFLTTGRKELAPFARAPQHAYLIRSVDPPAPENLPPDATVITARGPFNEAEEAALMKEHKITVLVSKNSGGEAAAPKLSAARTLHIPVVMIDRPNTGSGPTLSVNEAMDHLARRHAETALRGV